MCSVHIQRTTQVNDFLWWWWCISKCFCLCRCVVPFVRLCNYVNRLINYSFAFDNLFWLVVVRCRSLQIIQFTFTLLLLLLFHSSIYLLIRVWSKSIDGNIPSSVHYRHRSIVLWCYRIKKRMVNVWIVWNSSPLLFVAKWTYCLLMNYWNVQSSNREKEEWMNYETHTLAYTLADIGTTVR